MLSEVYINRLTQRSCITALQRVTRDNATLDYLAADFDLRDLPVLQTTIQQTNNWRHIKGEPGFRAPGLQQARQHTLMDEQVDDVVAIFDELISERGVFHGKLHFSSGQATLWLMDDPYHYRVHLLHEIIDPSICLLYRKREYPTSAVVESSSVRLVLERFTDLRFTRPHIYLRSGSINIMNGMVGVTFSNDSTGYLPAGDFLEANDTLWWDQEQVAAVNVRA